MMVWHGTSKTQAGKAILTDDQWLMLAKLAEDNEYWKAASDFMKSIDSRWLSSLSVKQVEWYNDIDARLEVEVNRHEGRIAYGLEEEDE